MAGIAGLLECSDLKSRLDWERLHTLERQWRTGHYLLFRDLLACHWAAGMKAEQKNPLRYWDEAHVAGLQRIRRKAAGSRQRNGRHLPLRDLPAYRRQGPSP